MTAAYVGLSADEGDAPGCIREALGELDRMRTLKRNSDLYVRERDGAPLLYSCVAEVELEGDLDSALSALRHDHKLLAAQAFNTADAVEPSWQVALADMKGISTPQTGSVRRIAHTARLQRVPDVDYDASQGAGAAYDELRPLSAFDLHLFNRVVESIERDLSSEADVRSLSVLDVGCGTGRFTKLLAARGFKTTGVDKSAVMLAAARASAAAATVSAEGAERTVCYRRCDANRDLPQGHWDALTFFFSAQYVAFDEPFWRRARTALSASGTIVFATFPHRHFIETDLTRFFPSIPRIDLARFPSIPALRRSLQANGFARVDELEVVHDDEITPAQLIGRIERKYLSSLHLLEPAEYEAGLHRMRSELRGTPSLKRTLRATVVSGRLQRKAS